MEISSDTDSDGELYNNAAKHIEKKRQIIDAKLTEYEKVLNLVDPEDSTYGHLLNEDCDLSLVDLTKSSSKRKLPSSPGSSVFSVKASESSSDSEDSLSLSELLNRYQNERRRVKNLPLIQQPKSKKSKTTTRKKKSRPRPSHSRRRSRQLVANARIIATVVLDDDSGYANTITAPIDFNSRSKSKAIVNATDISFSSLNTELEAGENEGCESSTVTIEWKGKERTTRKVFELRRYQKFERVFEDLAKIENIPISRVLLMHNYETVRPSDTPSSRNFKHYVALTGCISKVDIDFHKIVDSSDEDAKDKSNSNILIVKLQLESQAFSVSIMKHQNMSVLYEKCCEELKCSENNLKITFDGETVDPSESVTDLDLEGGEVFHVYLKT